MFEQPFQHDTYLELPKSFGEVDSDTLLSHARAYEQRELNAPTLPTQAEQARIAGSAFVEAALVLDDPIHEHDDYRLGLLDDGQAAFLRVIDYEEDLLESGQKNPDDHVALLKARLHANFKNVYADMVCGELTHDTKEEIIGFLNKHIHLTQRLRNELHKRDSYLRQNLAGLYSELRVLLDAWQGYHVTGDEIAIPASYRADNGAHRRRETHDITYFNQVPDTTFQPTGSKEVKTKSSFMQNNLGYLVRYKNSLAIVTSDDSITHY